MSSSTLKRQAISATIWSLIDAFGGYAIRFGSNLLLTRLLVPEYFGMMALIHPFISGLQMFSDIGIGPSIIQNKRGNDPDFLNTAWTIQVIRGLGLWLATLLIAWPIASFYQQPSFLWLVPIVGLNPLIASFNSTSISILRRDLEALKLTRYELLGYAYMNIITIFWACLNPTIWAIVGGSLVSKFINLIRSHRLIPTISNHSISNHFAWDKNAAKEIFSFGRWIFISTMMTFLATQLDRLMLGKLFPLEILGVYAVAIALAEMPRQLIQNISGKVIFPIIAKFQDLPRKQLREKIIKKRWILLIGMAFVVSMVVCFGDLLILALYDNRYKDAAWMLPILSLGMWPALLVTTNTTALIAIGKPIYIAIGNFVKFIYMFIGIQLGFSLMGIVGVIIVIAFNDLPIYLVVNYGLWKEGLTGIWQDTMTTSFLLLLIFCIIVCRHLLGFELPISSILL
ncbi:MAG: oligosaccharide flippase family protein [Calothrix sp. MO_192.B10]|nr:oligosaccharide flippase family protein [Calothrix sp. MO_192.B10]